MNSEIKTYVINFKTTRENKNIQKKNLLVVYLDCLSKTPSIKTVLLHRGKHRRHFVSPFRHIYILNAIIVVKKKSLYKQRAENIPRSRDYIMHFYVDIDERFMLLVSFFRTDYVSIGI